MARNMFESMPKRMFLFCACVTLCLTYLLIDFNTVIPYGYWSHNNIAAVSVNSPGCENILRSVSNGQWVQRNLTSSEKSEIDLVLLKSRTERTIPETLQRLDLKCGNVSFNRKDTVAASCYRAVCNPNGDTPCCLNGRCTQASVEQCRCEHCYDMRQQIHAEYSSWVPSNSKCHVKAFSREEACSILNGASITFVGDSLMRQMYTALLLILNDDLEYGAMLNGASSVTRDECRGMYMFTHKPCRLSVDRNTKACNGTVSLKINVVLYSGAGRILSNRARNMAQITKSVYVLGIGIHEYYNANKTILNFLKPILNTMYENRQKWPRILWASPHAPGLLKSPKVPEQGTASVLAYNTAVNAYLQSWNVPVLDTFNMTKDVMSYDGVHYGMGVNLMKARILLKYMKELQDKGVVT